MHLKWNLPYRLPLDEISGLFEQWAGIDTDLEHGVSPFSILAHEHGVESSQIVIMVPCTRLAKQEHPTKHGKLKGPVIDKKTRIVIHLQVTDVGGDFIVFLAVEGAQDGDPNDDPCACYNTEWLGFFGISVNWLAKKYLMVSINHCPNWMFEQWAGIDTDLEHGVSYFLFLN